MWKLIALSTAIMALVFVGLGIKIFFSKQKSFPETHVGENKNMKNLGIGCAAGEAGKIGACVCQASGKKKGSCPNQVAINH